MIDKSTDQQKTLTEHLFRNFYQEVFSSLVMKFGAEHIDRVEDALQDTFYKALKTWKFDAYPDNPKNWLFIVTRNNIINELRKSKRLIPNDSLISTAETITIESESAGDDQLQLLLVCSRLDIKPMAKLIFTLKAICGFGVTEIANSLLLTENNVYRIGQRAKQKLKNLPKEFFEINNKKIHHKDVEYLEQIVYFMFNEGYDSINKSSKSAINKAICYEAVRLAHLIEKQVSTQSIKNLLALFYFHMARFDSRLNPNGDFVSLRKQNRKNWDSKLIALGFDYLTKPSTLNRFYVEALIASLHSTAQSFETTNWTEILKLYDALLLLHDSPIIRLNRAICLFELKRHREAKKVLNSIKDQLADSYLYYSVSMAEYLSDKDSELSAYWYKKSLVATNQKFRKVLIQEKLKNINS